MSDPHIGIILIGGLICLGGTILAQYAPEAGASVAGVGVGLILGEVLT